MDANLLHISYEGEILEDLKNSPNETCGESQNPYIMPRKNQIL